MQELEHKMGFWLYMQMHACTNTDVDVHMKLL